MPPTLSDTEILQREPVWNALADLFLDTELQPHDYNFIAKRIIESPFTFAETERILWDEVFPALHFNLQVPAGEWAGFEPNWLKETILTSIGNHTHEAWSGGMISTQSVKQIIGEAWSKTCEYLPSNFVNSHPCA